MPGSGGTAPLQDVGDRKKSIPELAHLGGNLKVSRAGTERQGWGKVGGVQTARGAGVKTSDAPRRTLPPDQGPTLDTQPTVLGPSPFSEHGRSRGKDHSAPGAARAGSLPMGARNSQRTPDCSPKSKHTSLSTLLPLPAPKRSPGKVGPQAHRVSTLRWEGSFSPTERLPWLCCRCRPGMCTLSQEKVILLRFPACFSQGAHDMPSPRTVNKLAAIRGAGCYAWSQASWEQAAGRDVLIREVSVS